MLDKISVFLALIFEAALILVILILFIAGIAGILLPVIPGFILFGFGLAIYYFLLRNEKNTIIPVFHKQVIKVRDYAISNKKIMKLIQAIKKRNQEKVIEKTIKYGFILLGINFSMTLFLFFALTLGFNSILIFGFKLIFVPTVIVLAFISMCSIVWYRFGQIIAEQFKKNRILYSTIVVLISVVPLLFFLMFVSLLINPASQAFFLIKTIYFVTFFVVLIATIFEIFVINIGLINCKK